jgi:two-component system response regulator LytT
MKILVVDDDATVGRAIERQLRRDGVVHSEINPERAIEWVGAVAATDARFDVVICDYKMPTMTGLRVAEALSNLVDPPAFVLMTGFHDIDVPAEVVDGILLKPFNGAQLRTALAVFVDRGVRRRRLPTLNAA